jgi:hypothetical protein
MEELLTLPTYLIETINFVDFHFLMKRKKLLKVIRSKVNKNKRRKKS